MSTNDIPVGMTKEQAKAATDIVMQAAAALRGGDIALAVALAADGGKTYPKFIDPMSGQDIWAKLAFKIAEAQATAAAPVSAAPVSPASVAAAVLDEVAPVSAAPVSAAPVSAAPVSTHPVSAAPVQDQANPATLPGGPLDGGESLGTITFVHNAARGTYTAGVVKGDGSWDIMTSKGQRWNYTRTMRRNGETLPGYYRLGKSDGFMADLHSIGSATHALRAGGFTVLHEIDNHGCKAKPYSAARESRQHERRMAAQQQQRVTPAMGSDEPVSAAPVSPAPVSVAPVVVAAPVSAAPVSPAAVSVAPVSAQPVSAPRPPAPAQPTTPSAVDYTTLPDALLMAAATGGDRTAYAEVMARMARNAGTHVAAIPAAPVELTPATIAEIKEAAEPQLHPHVIVDESADTVEVWLDSEVSGRGMRAAARELRQALMHNLTFKVGSKGNRPEPHVMRVVKGRAFRVVVDVNGTTNAHVIVERVLFSAAKVAGVGSIVEARPEMLAREDVDA